MTRMGDTKHGLTPMQTRFVDAYVKDFNGAAAMRLAGSKNKDLATAAAQFLRNPKVNAEINRRITHNSERADVDVQWVIRQLVEVVYRAMRGNPRTNRYGEAVLDPLTGTPVMEWQPAAANKALELLGRHLGMFIDRQEVNVVYRSMVDQAIADLEAQLGEATGRVVDVVPANNS